MKNGNSAFTVLVSYHKATLIPKLPSDISLWCALYPSQSPSIDFSCSLLPRYSCDETVFSLISVIGSHGVGLRGWTRKPLHFQPPFFLPLMCFASPVAAVSAPEWRIYECVVLELDRPICALLPSQQRGGQVEPDSAYRDDTLYLREHASGARLFSLWEVLMVIFCLLCLFSGA